MGSNSEWYILTLLWIIVCKWFLVTEIGVSTYTGSLPTYNKIFTRTKEVPDVQYMFYELYLTACMKTPQNVVSENNIEGRVFIQIIAPMTVSLCRPRKKYLIRNNLYKTYSVKKKYFAFSTARSVDPRGVGWHRLRWGTRRRPRVKKRFPHWTSPTITF